LTLEGRLRHYNQTAADFYSDLFPYVDSQNYMARDKELSTFTSNSIGLTASYEIPKGRIGFIDRGSINFALDHIRFEYDDFRYIKKNSGIAPGSEPLYSFSANIMQFYISAWY
jgi:hypothetical protein